MSFRITGLSPAPFRHLYGLFDDGLAAHLDNPATAYLQAHYATRCCYAARIERA